MEHKRNPVTSHLICFRILHFFLLMSLIDNQTVTVIPQDATLPAPACLS